jgi:hypothetical protein
MAIDRLARTPGYQVAEVERQTLPARMTPQHTGGVRTTTYRIRHTVGGSIKGTRDVRGPSPVDAVRLRLTLRRRMLCVEDADTEYTT